MPGIEAPTMGSASLSEKENGVNGHPEKQDVAEKLHTAKERQNRILRYAEVFDLRTYTKKLVKTGKDKALDKKKPVLVEKRQINHKGIWTHTEVDIKSPKLRDILIEIHKDVEGLSLRKEPPFADPSLFFHSRIALEDRLSDEKKHENPDSSLVDDLSTALQYVEEHHGHNITTVEQMTAHNEISWSLLWALFTPNAMIYHWHQYTEQHQVLIFRHMKVRYRQDSTLYWQIMCDMIADDGFKFGYTKDLGITNRPDKYADIEIDHFEGARKIQDLTAYPLSFAQEPNRIRRDLIERGKKYVQMVGSSCWETSGPALREKSNDRYEVNRSRFSTHGRVMVDSASCRSFNPDWVFYGEVQSSLDRGQLTDNQLMICSPFVGGYGLGNKSWGGFPVSRLQKVVWTDEPFHSLVIGEKQKTLIHSLVKQHRHKGAGYDDVIQGKGLGLIGLLSGSPGVGKTLTAEAVSEATKRPLYAVSAGELGTEVEKVDKHLTSILELSHRWSAVLLLDEADVFLQERDMKDVTRNALVSIFLRQLEYFQGVLILTTNRLNDCDPAFESRIHFSIHYPDLDANARGVIWKQYIAKAHASSDVKISPISDKEIQELATHEMNGRQIKHAVGSARSIALEKQQPLDVSHIETVLEVVDAWNIARSNT